MRARGTVADGHDAAPGSWVEVVILIVALLVLATCWTMAAFAIAWFFPMHSRHGFLSIRAASPEIVATMWCLHFFLLVVGPAALTWRILRWSGPFIDQSRPRQVSVVLTVVAFVAACLAEVNVITKLAA